MSFNLIRNSRVFFTTNVDSQGRIRAGTFKDGANPFTVSNTFEIQVLEGMSFTQNTAQETITLMEAGATPSRGQRSFNTSLEPGDFSFSTYMRPFNTGTLITAEEGYLWNALGGSIAIGQANAAWAETATTATFTLANSNKHQLQAFGLIIVFDNQAYYLDNCALDSATIDFGLDQIAQIQWAGKFTQFRSSTNFLAGAAVSNEVTFTGTDVTGTTPDPVDKAKAKNTTARYLANKLTTLSVVYGGTTYNIAITGGNIALANNITYLTPANLGSVNLPITYFTGTRSVTGSLNAYLRSTANSTGPLLTALLANSSSEVDPKADIQLDIGGSTATTRVTIDVDTAMLQIPTVNTEQVISTQINFTGQGSTGGNFDITQNNEMTVTYRAAV